MRAILKMIGNRRILAAVLLSGAAFGILAASHRTVAQSSANPPISVPVKFTDIRESAGIDFQEDATPTAEKMYIETMGTGVGWIDYDQDGLLDLYLVQAAGTEWY